MRRVLVLGDERKGAVRSRVDELCRWLGARGIATEVDLDRSSSLEDRRADLVVVFGGDGSLLAAARRMGANQMPTVGINLGRLGFLTAFSDAEALEGIDRAIRGELCEEPRMMLSCRIERRDGSVSPSHLCLNDGVLIRNSAAGIITVTASRDAQQLATYAGDGVIVSTPVGSTAYSLAAGGPIVSPEMEALVVTPLAPHSLTLRPLVLSLGVGVFLEVLEAGGEATCTFIVDGQVTLDVAVGERVAMRPAPVRFRHLTRGPGCFFTILREKFGWAEVPRRETAGG